MTDPHAGLRSYCPGEWYAVLGPSVSLVLPPSDRSRAAAVWELVDDGAGIEEVLDALVVDGISGLRAFGLVGATDDGVRVVLRGGVRAHVTSASEQVELSGSDSPSWVDRELTSVSQVALVVADQPEGPDHLVEYGLVRVTRVDQPPRRSRVDAPPAASPAASPAATAEPAEPAEDTLAGILPPPPPLPPPPTQPTQPTQHTQPPGPPPSEPPPTVATPLASPTTGASRAAPVARLLVAGGEVVEVDRVVLVGRSPEPSRYSQADAPRLVTVASPRQEVSSTHLEIRPGTGPDQGAAVVTDLASTNGTVLAQPGLPPEALTPGVPVQLIPGAVLDLGDGVSIQVVAP